MRVMTWFGGGLLLVLLGAVTAEAQQPRPATAPAHRALRIAAASDLQFALEDIVREFHGERPEINVKVSYGSSGNFYAQISNGAPFDLFFSADVEYTRRLAAEKRTLPGSEFLYATGRLVLWVPKSSPLDVSRGFEALREPAVRRIAIANPRHAPYGRAAEAALRGQELYDEVKGRLIFGENVAQAAQFVQSGAADAGLIALSLALSPTLAREGRYWEVPADAHPRLEQGGVILQAARDREAAMAFRDFLLGARGRAALARYGFLPPRR